jgi:hypothetical protein
VTAHPVAPVTSVQQTRAVLHRLVRAVDEDRDFDHGLPIVTAAADFVHALLRAEWSLDAALAAADVLAAEIVPGIDVASLPEQDEP